MERIGDRAKNPSEGSIMATTKKKTKPAAPPAKNADPAPGDACDPLPTKDPKDGSRKPACPEGYPDRQPTKPPAQDPDQQPH